MLVAIEREDDSGGERVHEVGPLSDDTVVMSPLGTHVT